MDHSETGKGRGRGSKSIEIRSTTTADVSTPSRAKGGAERPERIAHSRGGGDLLLGKCSLNLVEVVSGRAPHIEEWVPLDRGGDLRLSLDYDSVGGMPAPGDSVRTMTTCNEKSVLRVAALRDPSCYSRAHALPSADRSGESDPRGA